MGQKIQSKEIATPREIFGSPDLESTLNDIKGQKFMDFVNVKDHGAVGDGITDDTEAIQNAIDFINTKGGGVIFFPYSENEYFIDIANIKLYDNIKLYGNYNNFYITSTPETKYFINAGENYHKNIEIKNMFIKSNNDQIRSSRETLSSNVYGLFVNGENIKIENIYFEEMESGIWLNNNTGTINKNIYVNNIVSLNTKQPLYMKNIKSSSFNNINFDCGINDELDHQIYVNAPTSNLKFNNLHLINGIGNAFNLKTPEGIEYNQDIFINNINIINVSGILLQNSKNININNVNIKSPNFKEKYCILFSDTENINIENFHLEGCNNIISTNEDNNDNINFNNGVINKSELHYLNLNNSTIIFSNIKFIDIPYDSSNRILYDSNTLSSKIIFNNCNFVNNTEITIRPFSIRNSNAVYIFQNCNFINNATEFTEVFDNRNGLTILKNNYYSGYTGICDDTYTQKYDNINLDTI